MPKFVTNQNIEIELELASVGDRIVAFIIDALIMIAYMFLMGIIVGGVNADGFTIFILGVPLFFYSLLFEVFGHGQSPGKRVRNIKVVKVLGSTPSLGGYILRWMFRLVDIYLLYGGIGTVTIAASKNAQRIGDMVAGTTVIKVREIGSAQAFAMRVPEDHKVKFTSAKMLSDNQIELMEKALAMHKTHGNKQGIEKLAIKLKQKLSVESDLNDLDFLRAVIDDYEYQANYVQP